MRSAIARGYQPLMRTYIGQGLRKDLEKLENDPLWELIDSLKRHGVEEERDRIIYLQPEN